MNVYIYIYNRKIANYCLFCIHLENWGWCVKGRQERLLQLALLNQRTCLCEGEKKTCLCGNGEH